MILPFLSIFILSVLSDMNDVFTSLLYGNGVWFGLLILTTLIIGMTFLWKYAGILALPICLFIGIGYLNNALGWQGLIMFLEAIFILGYLIHEVRK